MFKYLKQWMHLDFDDAEWAIYRQTPELNTSLARDNITLLKAVAAFSVVACLFIIATRGFTVGFSLFDTLPFAIGAVIFAIVGIASTSKYAADNPLKASWMLTATLSAAWFTIAIFYDTVVCPNDPTAFTCIAFVLIPVAFNSNPSNNIIAIVCAYACFTLFEMLFADPAYLANDMVNVFISGVAGIAMGQKKTASDASRLLYMDMYRTSSKATLLVTQVNMLNDTMGVLHLPSYVLPADQHDIPASEAIELVGRKFVAPKFLPGYLELFDFDTLPEKLAERGKLVYVYESVNNEWRQIIVLEQSRANGLSTAFVTVVHDIDFAHRQELEYQEKLRNAALDAERANASKTTFLRRMSHDVRTPINGIRGVLEMAEECPNDMEKQTELREKAREASGYLLNLVNSILDLNKLESGEVVLEHKPFDLHNLLCEANSITEMQAPGYNVEFAVDWDRTRIEHRHVIGSPTHLQQVTLNLATNALKYNRPGGTVRVWCEELSCEDGCATFRFVCTDTGLGMSEEFQQHCFEPFSQEDPGARSSYTGCGLGLSIVKEIVNRMGGTIALESTEGVGSTFTVEIPFEVDPNPAPDESQAERPLVDTTGKRALLVEDNELNREIAEFMLAKEGLEITGAANGAEALQAFEDSEEGHFDIVFMDIMMPKMGGLEATRRIRALNRADAKIVPILAMTANAFQDDVERSRTAGMNDHLAKPLDNAKLHDAIQRALANSATRNEA